MNAKGCSSKVAANRSSRVLTASLRSKLRMSGDETTHLLHHRKIGANPDPLATHFRKCECVPTAVPVNIASRNAKRCPCLLRTLRISWRSVQTSADSDWPVDCARGSSRSAVTATHHAPKCVRDSVRFNGPTKFPSSSMSGSAAAAAVHGTVRQCTTFLSALSVNEMARATQPLGGCARPLSHAWVLTPVSLCACTRRRGVRFGRAQRKR